MNLQKLFCLFVVTLVYFAAAENAAENVFARQGEQLCKFSIEIDCIIVFSVFFC